MGVRSMIVNNRLGLVLLAFLALALSTRNFVSAMDERTFQEASALPIKDKAEYVRHILQSGVTDDSKIAALKQVFHAGMSWNEIESICGRRCLFLGTGESVLCVFLELLGTDFQLSILCGDKGVSSFHFTTNEGKSLFIR
jgi:hypothetical protein